MAYHPYERSPSGIVFFGPSATDQAFESSSSFRIDTANSRLVAPSLILNNDGTIGTASKTNAITVNDNGIVTFSSGIIVTGDLTVQGDQVILNTQTVNVEDNIIVVNSNVTGIPTLDGGLEVERGTSANVRLNWDEGNDYWSFTNNGTNYYRMSSNAADMAGSGLSDGGLTNESRVLHIGQGDGITVNADSIAVNNTVVRTTGNQNISGLKKFTAPLPTTASFATFGSTDAALKVEMFSGNTNTDVAMLVSNDLDPGTTNTFAVYKDGNVNLTAPNTASSNVGYFAVFDTDPSNNYQRLKSVSKSDVLDDIGGASSGISITAGSGLVGGGDLSASRTLNIGQGDGISVSADAIAVDSTVVRTVGNQVLTGSVFLDLSGQYEEDSAFIIDQGANTKFSIDGLGNVFAAGNIATYGTILNATWDGSTIAVNRGGTGRSTYTNGQLLIGSGTSLAANTLTPGSNIQITNGSGTITIAATGVSLSGHTHTVSDITNFVTGVESGVFTSSNFVDGTTIDFTVTAGDSVTAAVKANSINEEYLTSSVAGSGLTGGNGSALAVNVDNSTVEISSDSVRIKDGGITAAKLAAGSVTESKVSRTVATIDSAVTLSSDINLVTSGAGGLTVTLPTAATGKIVIVKKVDSGAGATTVSGGSATIDGASTKILYYQYETMTFVSDGTNWYIV